MTLDLADGAADPHRAAPALDRDAAFVTAARHSAWVRRLKVGVPVLAAIGVVGFVAYAWLDPFHRPGPQVDVSAISVSDGRLTMELPHLTGFNRQQSYTVTAKTASQKITSPGQIELAQLDAVIAMADKSTAKLTARTGLFDSSAEVLTLDQAVNVTSTKGYKADLTSARVDFKAGTVVSDRPVTVDVGAGTIRAGGLKIVNGGQVISFSGGVTSRFQARVAKGDSKDGPDTSAPAQNGRG